MKINALTPTYSLAVACSELDVSIPSLRMLRRAGLLKNTLRWDGKPDIARVTIESVKETKKILAHFKKSFGGEWPKNRIPVKLIVSQMNASKATIADVNLAKKELEK